MILAKFLALAIYANLFAVSTSEKPFRGSSEPKWAITFPRIFYTFKLSRLGIP